MISSFYLFARSRLFEMRESFRIKKQFYRDLFFQELDQAILTLEDPFHISKTYLTRRAESNVYQYGETPLTTIAIIAKRFHIERADTVIEMGSGSGRVSFMLSHFTGCKVIGIERIDTFVNQANKLAKCFKRDNVHFICGNMLKESWDGATYLYLYQSMLSDREIEVLCARLEALDRKIKVITVSYSLKEYNPNFRVLDHMQGSFPFGKAEVYLNEVSSLKK